MDAQSVKVKLLAQLVPALEYLMPNGKVKGREFLVGNIQGDSGKSLSVQLDGDRAGLWKDHANPENKGDIYTLWMMHRGLTFVDALNEIKKYLGVTEVKRLMEKKPQGYKPTDATGMRGTQMHKYLNEVRGISDTSLVKYKVRTHPNPASPAYAFQYITSDGKKAHMKYCSLDRDEKGKKKIWSTAPYPTLWGWWLVTQYDRSIIITEGEIDAMSIDQMVPGVPVLSMHSGTGNLNWIDNDYHALNQFETIYVVTDRDDAGDKCAEEMSKRLGQSRVMRVPVPKPYNDPNEAFLSGDERLADWNFWLKDASYFMPDTIRMPISFLKEAHRLLDKAKEEKEKSSFMFTDVPFAYRDGETTIISGEPGHGKSDWLYQSHIHEMINDKKVMVCSLEIPPAKMLTVLVQQKLGSVPSHEEATAVAHWLNDRMVYHSGHSQKGPDHPLTWDELISDMEYAYRRFGITRFIIDSLHFLVAKEDYEAQDKITRSLQQFDLNHNVHTALVAHANLKGRNEKSIPGRHDVEGSGGMIKPIDNGLTIWRNEEKMDQIQDPLKYSTTKEKAEGLHDGIIKIWKQRETGDHGTYRMWFDKGSRTFRMQSYGVGHFFSRGKPKEEEEKEEQTEF